MHDGQVAQGGGEEGGAVETQAGVEAEVVEEGAEGEPSLEGGVGEDEEVEEEGVEVLEEEGKEGGEGMCEDVER